MRAFFTIGIIACALFGCGAPPSEGDATPSAAAPTSTPPAPEPEAAVTSSLYVADNAAKPPCDAARANHIVYVASLKTLQACLNETWVVVDLPKGADGANGENGKDGANGKDGESVLLPTNEWLDDVSGNVWLIGGAVPRSTEMPCGAGDKWRVPNNSEVEAACLHGLSAEFKSASAFFTTTASISNVISAGTCKTLSLADSVAIQTFTLACVKVGTSAP